MTFHGIFDHTLDSKHRLTLPAKYRAEFANGVVLALAAETDPGGPRSIMIWRPDDYAEFTRSVLAGLNPASPKARKLQEFFFAGSDRTEPDAANRVMIPTRLLAYAGIDREVTVTGAGAYMAIWDRARFGDGFDSLLTEIPDITASLGNTD